MPPGDAHVVSANYVKLWFGQLFFMLNMSAFNLLPYYLELRGASPDLYGSVAGSMGVSNVLSLLLLGRWADRWSRKSTVSVYFAVAFAGNLLAVGAMYLPDLHWYFAVRLLQGVFMGLGFPLVFSWMVELSPPHLRQLALAWFGISGILANSLGPTLAELVLSLQPDPNAPEAYLPVWLMATAAQLVALGFFLWTRNVQPQPVAEGGAGLRPLLRRSESLLVLAVAVSFGGLFGVLMSFSKNYTAWLGLSYVSLLLWAYTTGAVSSRIFMAGIMRRVTEQHMIPLGLLGVGVSFLVMAGARDYPVLVAGGLLYGVSHGILFPTLFVRFLNMQQPNEMGRAATLFQGSFSIGWGLIPLAGGAVVGMTNFPTFYSLLATLAGIGIWLHLRAERAVARRQAAEVRA